MDTFNIIFSHLLTNPVFIITALIIGFLALIGVYLIITDIILYKKSTYYAITHHPYIRILFNIGLMGEYLTYKNIRHLENFNSKFLFNIYIPKGNSGTSEIDLLMISTKGIFVFESKNYSGWIFGTENQQYWYQTLPTGRSKSRKEQFFNPVMQNNTHIKHLQALLPKQVPIFSVIVFSDRCTLKSINVQSSDTSVIHRCDVAATINTISSQRDDTLNPNEIDEIYNKLYPFTQVDMNVKKQHINDIQEKQHSHITQTQQQINQTDMPCNIQSKKCPWCNGTLATRTSKHGPLAGSQFYGCSNYPKCKYTQHK